MCDITEILERFEKEAIIKFDRKIATAEAEVITVRREKEAYLDGAYDVVIAIKREIERKENDLSNTDR